MEGLKHNKEEYFITELIQYATSGCSILLFIPDSIFPSYYKWLFLRLTMLQNTHRPTFHHFLSDWPIHIPHYANQRFRQKKYFFFQMSDTFRRAHFFPVCDLWSQDSNFCLYFLNLYICLMILSITLYLTKLNKAINRIPPLICLMNLRHLSMIPWILNSYLMFQCFNPCQENKCHMSTSSCCHII